MSHRIDFHCHTTVSPDGAINESNIRKKLKTGLDSIVITDHDRIDEAIRLQKVLGDQIIIGEEISALEGEIIGIYLTQRVEPGLSAAETVSRIKAQNGLVYIPHPFEKVRKGLQQDVLDAIMSSVDIIEVINGRSFSSKARDLSLNWAKKNNKPGAASSDAHGNYGWGRVYTILSDKPDSDTLASLITSATLHGTSNGYVSYVYPKLNRIRKWIKR